MKQNTLTTRAEVERSRRTAIHLSPREFAQKTKARTFIGTSGWNYKDWRGIFYPPKLPPPQWMEYYSRSFDTVEVNNTFYRLPEKQVFSKWYRESPTGFTFAVKVSRFVTHMKKLADPEIHVRLLLDRACALREKLGIILFQLPPFWRFNAERLQGLCRYMRRQKIVPRLRYALEVRHESWLEHEALDTLRDHNVALVLADWPTLNVEGPITADFVFVRRHGPGALYASNYSMTALRAEARCIRTWLGQGRDVYIYFNNDVNALGAFNAISLRKLLEDSDEPPSA